MKRPQRAPERAGRLVRLPDGKAHLIGAAPVTIGREPSSAMGVGSKLLGWGPGIVAGKLVADLACYLPVIWIYERRRRSGAGR